MATNIQIVKLTTGEDLIGDLEELEIESRAFLKINKPMVDDIKVQNETGKEWIEYYINTAY